MKFVGGGLGVFRRLFQLPGSSQEAPTELAIESPVQPVYDISRQLELGICDMGPGLPGFFQVGKDNVHGGAGSLSSTTGVYTVLDQFFGADSHKRLWAWLMWCDLSQGAGILVEAALSLNIAPLGNAVALRDFVVAHWNSFCPIANTASHTSHGVNRGDSAIATTAILPHTVQRLPMVIPAGSLLGCYSEATGGGTVRFNTICWVGPLGVNPLGLF